MSLRFIAGCSVVSFLIAFFGGGLIASLFVSVGSPAHALATAGSRYFAVSYLFMGTGIFSSFFFAGLSESKKSAILSLLQNLAFLVAGLLVLPELFEGVGIWLATPIAELLAFTVAAYFLKKKFSEFSLESSHD